MVHTAKQANKFRMHSVDTVVNGSKLNYFMMLFPFAITVQIKFHKKRARNVVYERNKAKQKQTYYL